MEDTDDVELHRIVWFPREHVFGPMDKAGQHVEILAKKDPQAPVSAHPHPSKMKVGGAGQKLGKSSKKFAKAIAGNTELWKIHSDEIIRDGIRKIIESLFRPVAAAESDDIELFVIGDIGRFVKDLGRELRKIFERRAGAVEEENSSNDANNKPSNILSPGTYIGKEAPKVINILTHAAAAVEEENSDRKSVV